MAIPDHLTLEIVTPERSIAHGEVDEVVVPGSEGSFGVLPGHTPLLSTLAVGEVEYRRGGETSYVAVVVRVRRGPARPRNDSRADCRAE